VVNGVVSVRGAAIAKVPDNTASVLTLVETGDRQRRSALILVAVEVGVRLRTEDEIADNCTDERATTIFANSVTIAFIGYSP
jgi:hypothetical protein